MSPKPTKADAIVEDFMERDRAEKETRRWLLEERIREQRKIFKEIDHQQHTHAQTHAHQGHHHTDHAHAQHDGSHGQGSRRGSHPDQHHHHDSQTHHRATAPTTPMSTTTTTNNHNSHNSSSNSNNTNSNNTNGHGSHSKTGRGAIGGSPRRGKHTVERKRHATASNGISRIRSPTFGGAEGSRESGHAARRLMADPRTHRFNSRIGEAEAEGGAARGTARR